MAAKAVRLTERPAVSQPTLDPEFEKNLLAALREVSARDIGPIQASDALADLGLDSVSVAELFNVLEDTLDVSLEPEQLARLVTFGDLQELITRLQQR